MLPQHADQMRSAVNLWNRALRAMADLKVRSAAGENVSEALETVISDGHHAKQLVEMIVMSHQGTRDNP